MLSDAPRSALIMSRKDSISARSCSVPRAFFAIIGRGLRRRAGEAASLRSQARAPHRECPRSAMRRTRRTTTSGARSPAPCGPKAVATESATSPRESASAALSMRCIRTGAGRRPGDGSRIRRGTAACASADMSSPKASKRPRSNVARLSKACGSLGAGGGGGGGGGGSGGRNWPGAFGSGIGSGTTMGCGGGGGGWTVRASP